MVPASVIPGDAASTGSGRSPSQIGADLAAPTLVLLVPLLTFVTYNAYDLASLEVLAVAGLMIGAGLAIGAVVALAREPWRAFILAMVVSIGIDLLMPDLAFHWLLVLPVVAYLVVRVLSTHATTVVTMMAAAAMASVLLFPDRGVVYENTVAPPTVHDEGLPPVIHIVLDEYGSIEGLPPEMGFSEGLATEIESFFTGEGFRLFGGAYSQYFNTYNALGNVLNFTSADIDAAHFEEPREPFRLIQGEYFRMLEERGYGLRVYQSTFLDYCRIPSLTPDSCTTYSMNSIKYLEDLDVPMRQKAQQIYHSLMSLSMARSAVRFGYNEARDRVPLLGWLPFWKSVPTLSGPLPVPPLFDEVARDVAADGGGYAYFAHFLVPHSPYLLNRDCTVKMDTAEWHPRSIHDYAWPEPNSADSRRTGYSAYAEQLRCTNQIMKAFFDQLRRGGVLEDAIVVVHGDHGARINRNWPTVPNREKLRDSDFIDGFPTLFAVKSPEIAAGYSRERRTLTSLLGEVWDVPVEASSRSGVYLFDGPGEELVRAGMPDAWMEAEAQKAEAEGRHE